MKHKRNTLAQQQRRLQAPWRIRIKPQISRSSSTLVCLGNGSAGLCSGAPQDTGIALLRLSHCSLTFSHSIGPFHTVLLAVSYLLTLCFVSTRQKPVFLQPCHRLLFFRSPSRSSALDRLAFLRPTVRQCPPLPPRIIPSAHSPSTTIVPPATH